MVKTRLQSSTDEKERAALRSIPGKVAIANARLTYQLYKKIFSGPEWEKLAKQGAQTQRVLWASTSTKDPSYPDVLYVDELIGPDTVNTIPPATFDAFRDHGKPRASLESGLDAAQKVMDTLRSSRHFDEAGHGRSGDAGREVVRGAVRQAAQLGGRQVQAGVRPRTSIRRRTLCPPRFKRRLQAATEDWKMAGKVRRLWARDASLWTGTDEGSWLGWLGITEDELAHRERFTSLAADIKSAGFKYAVLLGMGGSSLCPEVLKMTFGKADGFPEMFVLDSTDPAQVKVD